METLTSLFLIVLKASGHATLLVGVILSIRWLLHRHLSASWCHALWFALIVRLVIPFMPGSAVSPINWINSIPLATSLSDPGQPQTVPSASFQSSGASLQTTAVPTTQEPSKAFDSTTLPAPPTSKASPSILPSIHQIAALVWLSVAVALFTRLLLRNERFRRQFRRQSTTEPQLLNALKKAQATLLLQHRRIQLTPTNQVERPCILGLLKPQILFPAHVVNKLSSKETEHVFLHELAHLKRHDIALGWLTAVLRCLHWFNPVVWFGIRKLESDRELATDELVLKHLKSHDNQAYGETIIKLLEHFHPSRTQQPGLIGIVESNQSIKDRIQAIADFAPARRQSVIAPIAASCLLGMFLLEAKPAPLPQQNPPIAISSKTSTMGVRFQVHHFEDGQPLNQSAVKVRPDWWDSESESWDNRGVGTLQASTNRDGIAIIESLPKRALRYQVTVSHPEYLTVRQDYHATQHPLPEYPRFDLIRGQRIGGVILGPDGKPLTETKVSIDFSHPYSRRKTLPPDRPIVTDEQGRWEVDALPPGINQVTLTISHGDFALPPSSEARMLRHNSSGPGKTVLPAINLLSGDHQLSLVRGGHLHGQVLAPDNRPLAGAQVRLPDLEQAVVVTDKNGRFEFDQAFIGPVKGTITVPNHAPYRFERSMAPGESALTLRLGLGSPLTIHFSDESGQNVPGVQVIPETWHIDDFTATAGSRRADENGHFTWSNAPASLTSFTFLKTGYQALKGQRLAPGSKPHPITLTATPKITFLVTDSEGQPVPRFTVDHGLSRSDGANQVPPFWPNVKKWSGQDGQLTIQNLLPADLGYPNTKSFVYRVEAPGFQSVTTHRMDEEQANITLRLRLPASNRPLAQLQLPSGRALPNRSLWVLAENTTYSVSEDLTRLTNVRGEHLRTDNDGRFQPPIRQETYYLLALLPEGFLLVPDDHESPFIVQPWSSVHGLWTEEGVPAEKRIVGFRLKQNLYPSRLHLNFKKTVLTDNNGKFKFDRVPPTDLDILYRLASASTPQNNRFAATLSVPPDTVKTITIGQPRLRTITGSVTIPPALVGMIDPLRSFGIFSAIQPPPPTPNHLVGDQAAVNAWYQEWTQTQEGAQHHQIRMRTTLVHTKPDGHFAIPNVYPGEYSLGFRFNSLREATAVAPHGPGASATLTIPITRLSPATIELGDIAPEMTR